MSALARAADAYRDAAKAHARRREALLQELSQDPDLLATRRALEEQVRAAKAEGWKVGAIAVEAKYSVPRIYQLLQSKEEKMKINTYTIHATINVGETLSFPVSASTRERALELARRLYPQGRNHRIIEDPKDTKETK